jgi:hypothetical protein
LEERRENEMASGPGSAKRLIYTAEERRALRRLRRRYHDQQEGWSESELAHLCFLRWLHRTGRLMA